MGRKEIAWFTSYLSDHKQRVMCGGQFSEWSLVNGGIPQGSALGPLLFLIYMNEMPSQVSHGKLLQYADDTALICSGTDFAEIHRCTHSPIDHFSRSHGMLIEKLIAYDIALEYYGGWSTFFMQTSFSYTTP